jgi:hypothetical protein
MEFPAIFKKSSDRITTDFQQNEKNLEFPTLFNSQLSNSAKEPIEQVPSREELIKRLRSKYRRNQKPNTMESQLAAYTKLPESDIKTAVLGISRKKMARNPLKVARKIAEMLAEPNLQ